MENHLRTDLALSYFELEDGIMRIPDCPWIGVEIDEEALRRYGSQ